MYRKNLIFILLIFLAIAAFAEGTTKFFVPEKQIEFFKKEYGEQALRRVNSLLVLMEGLINSPEDEIVIAVNRFFNQVEYRSDIKTWKKKDYFPGLPIFSIFRRAESMTNKL